MHLLVNGGGVFGAITGHIILSEIYTLTSGMHPVLGSETTRFDVKASLITNNR